MRRNKRLAAAVSFGLLVGLPGVGLARDGFEVRLVIEEGDPAPGFPSGSTMAPFIDDTLGIDKDGNVMFSAEIIDLDFSTARAVYLFSGTSFTPVYHTGGSVNLPFGGVPFGTLTDVPFAQMGRLGDVGVDARIDQGAFESDGIVVRQGGINQTVDATDVFPSPCPLQRIGEFRLGTAAYNNDKTLYKGQDQDWQIAPGCVPGELASVFRRIGHGLVETVASELDEFTVAHDPANPRVFSGAFLDLSIDPNGNAGFIAAYSDPAGPGQAVFLRKVGGDLKVVAAAGGTIPGTAERFLEFFHMLVDDGPLADDGAPRIAFVALGDVSASTYVMDQAEDPPLRMIMSTGTLRSGVRFAGGPTTRLLSAGRGKLLIVGEIQNPPVPNGQGVWRYNPLLPAGDARVQLLLYAGAPAPGMSGAEIRFIRNVYANAEGEAAVLADVRDKDGLDTWALFMEDGGKLKLAATAGDPVTGKPRRYLGGNNTLTGHFGCGEAGRGTRFNDAGSLVFSAAAGEADGGSGVLVVSRKSGLPSATVTIRAVKRGKTLYVTGTAFVDKLGVQIEGGAVTLTGLGGSTVNGVPQPPPFGNIENIVVKLLDGDDELSVGDLTGVTATMRSLGAVMGKGNDRVNCSNLLLKAKARIDMGSSAPDGKDVVILDAVRAESFVEIIERNGGFLEVQMIDGEIEKALRVSAKKARKVSLNAEGVLFGAGLSLKGQGVEVMLDGCRSTGSVEVSGTGEDFDIDLIDIEAPLVKLNSRAVETAVRAIAGAQGIGSLDFNFKSDDLDLEVLGDAQDENLYTSVRGRATGAGTAELRFDGLSAADFELLVRKYADASVEATDTCVEQSSRWRGRGLGRFGVTLTDMIVRGRNRMSVKAGAADVSVTGSRFEADSQFDLDGGDATVQIAESVFQDIMKLDTKRGNDTVSLNDLFFVACQFHTGAGDDTVKLFGDIEASQLLARLGSGNDTLTGDALLTGMKDVLLDGQSGVGDRMEAVIRGLGEGPVLKVRNFEVRF